MPRQCAVYGCFSSQRHNKDLNFHIFPKDESRRKTWIHLCKRKDPISVDKALICSLHFDKSAYENHMRLELLNLPKHKSRARLKEDAIPTLLLPTSQGKKYIFS